MNKYQKRKKWFSLVLGAPFKYFFFFQKVTPYPRACHIISIAIYIVAYVS